jgi:hypothetical protein
MLFHSKKKITIDFQHAHREEHSTSTALTQMTNDWLREIDYKIIEGCLVRFQCSF